MDVGAKRSTCGFCSTGCTFLITRNEAGEIKVAPNPDYPVNRGTSCPKGFLHLEPLKAADRATSPMMRNARGELEPVSWAVALDAFVANFKRILKKQGRDGSELHHRPGECHGLPHLQQHHLDHRRI
jgi:assimilatory nitrate reductase catalytic subunit